MKKKSRGTKRQQQYRAIQQLLQLCALASAQRANDNIQANEKIDDTTRSHVIDVHFYRF